TRARPVERPLVQPTHAQPHALRIHADHLDPVAAAVAEHVRAAGARILAQPRADRPQQTIDPAAKIDRLQRQPPAGRTQHSARTSAASAAAGRAGTRSRTPLGSATSTSVTDPACAGDGVSIATGTSADERRCQYTNCE